MEIWLADDRQPFPFLKRLHVPTRHAARRRACCGLCFR